MSISKKLMPSCFFAAGSVRTRQKIQSEWCALEVQILWPLTRKCSPFAADDGRDVGLALLLGAVFEQDGAEHRQAHAAQGGTAAELLHFLFEDQGLVVRQAAAAVLCRPGRGGPANGCHAVEPLLLLGAHIAGAFAAGDLFVLRHEGAHGGRAVLLQPGAGFGAEGGGGGHGRFLAGFRFGGR
jgi:hypothetical protein